MAGNAVKKARSARTLLDPVRYPSDGHMHLFGSSRGALVDEAKQVPEASSLGALRHHPRAYLVAHQDHRLANIARTLHEPLELLQCPILFVIEHPGRNPQG